MLTHVCVCLFIFGLASAQQSTPSQTTNNIPHVAGNLNEKSIAPQPQISPLTYQNPQPAVNPSLIPTPQNLIPQAQFNPLAFQNPQPGNPLLQPLANQGLINPQLEVLPDGTPLNNAGFQFNPQLVPNQNTQFQNLIRVPQPYPVYIPRPVPVQIPIRVPVEVPKPYPVQVPHPVPVPVQIRVPVPIAKPYPVEITRTVPVPVEKPVYIRIPHVIPEQYQQQVAHPYHNGPQNILQGYQQQLLNFGQLPNGGQFLPQEVQIGGRLQANPEQLQVRGQGQLLGAPLSPQPNGGSSNLQSETRNPANIANGVRLNEIPNGGKGRPT